MHTRSGFKALIPFVVNEAPSSFSTRRTEDSWPRHYSHNQSGSSVYADAYLAVRPKKSNAQDIPFTPVYLTP